MTIELVSYADLKSYLGLTEDGIDDYPALDVIRDSVTAAIESHLGRSLESTSRSTTFFGPKISQHLNLSGIPIAAVNGFVNNTTGQSVDEDAYDIADFGLILYFLPGAGESYTLTYTGGLSAVPDELKRAALIQTAYEFQNKERVGAQQISTDGGTVSVPSIQLLPEVKRTISGLIHPLKL